MPLSDASLSAATVYPSMLLFADFQDFPIRAAFAPYPLTVPGGLTDADAECAGFTFDTITAGVLEVAGFEHAETGTQTLQLRLRAEAADTELLAAIENPALYVGRPVRIWLVLHDGAGTVVQISPSLGFTGYMSVPQQQVDPEGGAMAVIMEVENWLAILGGASSRTYLIQKRFDANDLSADVSLGNAAAVPGLTNFNGGSGGAFDFSWMVNQR